MNITHLERHELLLAWQQVEEASADLRALFSHDALPPIETVARLLNRGARVKSIDMGAWENILDHDDDDMLSLLIEVDPIKPEREFPLLARASEMKAVRCVSYLAHLPGVWQMLQTDEQILEKAIRADFVEVVRALLAAGAGAQDSLRFKEGIMGQVKSCEMFDLLHATGARLCLRDLCNQALFFPRPDLLAAMVVKYPGIFEAEKAYPGDPYQHDNTLHSEMAWSSLLQKADGASQNQDRLECAKILRSKGLTTLAGPCPLAAWPVLLRAGFSPTEVEWHALENVHDKKWVDLGRLVSGMDAVAEDRPYDVATELLCQAADLGLDITRLWEAKPQGDIAKSFARAGAEVAPETPNVSEWDIADGQARALARTTAGAPKRPQNRL